MSHEIIFLPDEFEKLRNSAKSKEHGLIFTTMLNDKGVDFEGVLGSLALPVHDLGNLETLCSQISSSIATNFELDYIEYHMPTKDNNGLNCDYFGFIASRMDDFIYRHLHIFDKKMELYSVSELDTTKINSPIIVDKLNCKFVNKINKEKNYINNLLHYHNKSI